MSDAETIRVYDARARDYADKFGLLKADRNLMMFMELLPRGGEILDLGCGPGNTAKILANAGFRVQAIDASAEMVRLAREKFEVNARQATFSELDAVSEFDGIWANFSLLHVPRNMFDGHLSAIARALRGGGAFHIGMKTGEGAARDGLDRAYTYYSIADLRARLGSAGFDVVNEVTGSDPGLAGTVDPWVVLLARKSHG